VRVARRTNRRCSLPHAALFRIAGVCRRRLAGCLFQPALQVGILLEQTLFADFGPLRAAQFLLFGFRRFLSSFGRRGFGLFRLAFFAFRSLFRDLLRSIKVDNAVIDRRCGGFSRGRAVQRFRQRVGRSSFTHEKAAPMRTAVETMPAECAGLVTGRSPALRLSHLLHRQIVLLAGAVGLDAQIVMSAPWRSIACAWSREWLTWPRAMS
jgi:hypothetical protein